MALVDPWTLGHVMLGFGLAWLGYRLLPVAVIALAWECLEALDVLPWLGDTGGGFVHSLVDVGAVLLGWWWHVCHGVASRRVG